jgi:hypothetical protein
MQGVWIMLMRTSLSATLKMMRMISTRARTDDLALIGQDASLLVQGEIEIDKSGQGTSNDPSQDKEFSGDTTPGSKFERVEFNDWFTVNEEDVASADSSP